MRTYEAEELTGLIPELAIEFGDEEADEMGLKSIVAGVLGVKCGNIDPDALARALEAEFVKLGGEVFYGTEVRELIVKPKRGLVLPGEPFVWQDLTVAGAETSRGVIETETTVVAAGVWAERLLAPLGFDPFMRPKSRVIFVFDDSRLRGLRETTGFSDVGSLPFTQVPGISVYLKADPSEGTLWLGCADDLGGGTASRTPPNPTGGSTRTTSTTPWSGTSPASRGSAP